MKEITTKEYEDRVLGSWFGRCAGSHLGAPLEFRPYNLIKKMHGEITYFTKPVDPEHVNDDEMYEICALVAFEKKGIDLTARDIAQEWHDRLYKLNFTAERVALKNFEKGIWPPESGAKNNIYYDAIGAQMRADIFGQISPGCPKIAKKYAEMDGCISHAGIGIEGEVFVAVLLSNAFFEPDIAKNIDKALKFLPEPEESLYVQMVHEAKKIYEEFPADFRRGREKLIDYWHDVRKNKLKKDPNNTKARNFKFLNKIASGVHVLPNAGIIVLSLLHGAQEKEDPLGRSICLTAMMGLDTDCNCGNIGAIIGAQVGASKIHEKWIEPLKNNFSTYVKGYEKWKITELASRVAAIGKKVIEKKCSDEVRII